MTTNRNRFASVVAAIFGGVLILGGIAAAPALAYPPGEALTISCDKSTYAVGETATCTMTNINPAGPNSIVPPAGSTNVTTGTTSGNSFTVSFTVPPTSGSYKVTGTSAGESASTNIQVGGGQPTPFSLVVNNNGTVTVKGGTPGCTVTVSVNGQAAGSGTVGSDGTVTISVNVPTGATVTASQTASDTCAAVTTPPVVAGGGGGGGGTTGGGGGATETPQTGANVAFGLLAGLGALGIGGGLYAASRRKRV